MTEFSAVDFHNHLLPGVDDGASSIEETRAGLQAMTADGVRTVIVTPHLRGMVTERPDQLAAALAEFDEALEAMRTLVAAEFSEIRLERGAEVMLDTPGLDLSDPRVRLAGTSFVLVEFPSLSVPPHSIQALYELKLKGWRPIVAHPERYHNLDGVDLVEEWRTVGALMQVNAGSLVGRYGERASKLAWSLLERGWVDYLSSDYHARGRLRLTESWAALREAGGEEQLNLLSQVNPSRMLNGEDPIPVAPLQRRRSLWRRLLGRRG